MSMTQAIQIHDLLISEGHDFKGRKGLGRLNHGVSSVDSVHCVAGKGIEGDRFFGYKDDFKGQITFISLEMIADIEAELGIQVADRRKFRRNVVTSGVDLNALVGKTFRIGQTRFLGTEQCRPCFWMDEAVSDGAFAAMEKRGGLRCRILDSGTLSCGSFELEVIDS